MKFIALYIITILLSAHQADNKITTRTYKFEHTSNANEPLTDYIQLIFKNDSVIKGAYHGNDFGCHYVADIKFDKQRQNNSTLFSLINYRFCRENSDPFKEAEFYNIEKVPFELEHKEGIHFMGKIYGTQLNLSRILWFYDSRFDKMKFTLEKEE